VAGVSDDSTCNIELKPPISESATLAIGKAFEQAFPRRNIIINGLDLEDVPGAWGMPWTPHTWPPGLRPSSWWDRLTAFLAD
jgi:hypothetical protein